MIVRRAASARGHAYHGWLDTYHTFSFAGYQDPGHMHFRALRVMNEDRVAPGKGFGTHGHDNMEIVTYVLEGVLAHRDSLGHRATLGPGEFQRITAGSGITHSEFNASEEEPVHFYQIWLYPNEQNLDPSYEQKHLDPQLLHDRLHLVAAPEPDDGALRIHQDAQIYLSQLGAGRHVEHPLVAGRHAWLQVLRGDVTVNGEPLGVSDGAAISNELSIVVQAQSDAEVMLFDLA